MKYLKNNDLKAQVKACIPSQRLGIGVVKHF